MKIVIVDDEPLARQYIRECLEGFQNIEIAAECTDGFEGLKAIQEHAPDLIFLDIQMPRINGFEMLELLEEPPAVIFTTAFDEYALKAFEASAVDYLLKPFGKDRFNKAMEKAGTKTKAPVLNSTAGKSAEEMHRIVLRHQGEIRIIPTSEIFYLEAWDDYVKIHTSDQVYVKKQTLTFYEQSLDPGIFVRCHRSILVNTGKITAIDHGNGDSWELRLSNGFHVAASRQGYSKLKEVMGL